MDSWGNFVEDMSIVTRGTWSLSGTTSMGSSSIATGIAKARGEGNIGFFDGGDEVNDLSILRMMARPAYIIACYTAVVDKLVNPELVAGEESRRSTETYRCSCQQHLAELTE